MTTSTVTLAPPLMSGPSLKTLAWREVGRYARHPLFLICLVLMLVQLALFLLDDTEPLGSPAELTFFAALCLGLLGTIVAYRLAKSLDPAIEVADTAPVPRTTRTAALCMATLLPLAVGAVTTGLAVVGSLARWSDYPFFNSGMSSTTMLYAWLAGVVACAGGPLFGIMVARWTSFPGAGLLAVVALLAWTLLGTGGLAMAEPSRFSALVHMLSPAASWTSSDGPHMPLWVVEGSPLAYLAYVITLCLLGATLAIVRDAEGEQRKRLWRVFGVLAVVALVALGLSMLTEPIRMPLNLTV